MFKNKFFHDRIVLVQAFLLGLLALGTVASVMIRTDLSQRSTILQYWTALGLPEFDKQSPQQLYGFAMLAVISVIIGIVVSYKLHGVNKYAAYTFLALSSLAVIINFVVSGALLSIQQ